MRIIFALCMACLYGCTQKPSDNSNNYLVLSKEALKDKIMGGWAGQTIGVTYGGPYEFSFLGSFIQDYQPLTWNEGYLKKTMTDMPGLYDDLYMDLSFMNVIERYGTSAPVDSFANAFAYAAFKLWHANQSARYNIMHGIKPPASGYYKNNPHADDIDFQIESDFAGLMSPGMPNTAAAIGDKIGHIMCYGDGWYGGVFVSAMYALAFRDLPVNSIVDYALKTIPTKSGFYQCMTDVIRWHHMYPNDWHTTWFEIQKKWSEDIGCPDGVFNAFNIDAKLNAAYVVMALLYGNGNFENSLNIATRAGQDADCNPSTVAGVLGTKMGYANIPPKWKAGLKEIESMNFLYTDISLHKAYELGFQHAMNTIKENSGIIGEQNISIKLQEPEPVRFEQSFTGIYPSQPLQLSVNKLTDTSFSFHGIGILVKGEALPLKKDQPDFTLHAAIYIDGTKKEEIKLPTSFTTRRNEIYWNYDLEEKDHTLRIKILNPSPEYQVNLSGGIIYKGRP